LLFHGIHDHSLDAKNRLTIPAKARRHLEDGVTLWLGFEHCVSVWPSADYAQIAQQALHGLNPLGKEARDLKRHLFGNTVATELDSAGRIALPPAFAAHADISKDVKVLGAGECLELWNPEAWAAQNDGLIDRAADHIANVGHPA